MYYRFLNFLFSSLYGVKSPLFPGKVLRLQMVLTVTAKEDLICMADWILLMVGNYKVPTADNPFSTD